MVVKQLSQDFSSPNLHSTAQLSDLANTFTLNRVIFETPSIGSIASKISGTPGQMAKKLG